MEKELLIYLNQRLVQKQGQGAIHESFFPEGIFEYSLTLLIILFFVTAHHEFKMFDKKYIKIQSKK